MKAQDLQFTQLIQGAKQFIIPIFQRTYSWELSHCEQLWNDIMRVGNHAELDSHFIGSKADEIDAPPAAAGVGDDYPGNRHGKWVRRIRRYEA